MSTPTSPLHTRMDVSERNLRPLMLSIAVASGLVLSGYRCPIHAATGWYCPGCGGTRAVGALLRGDVMAALRDNLLLFTVLPLVALTVVRPEGALASTLERHKRAAIATAVVITVAYVLSRNTVAPWLAPL